MSEEPSISIIEFSDRDMEAHLDELGALLYACVHAGASIGFVLPFSEEEASMFWRSKILPGVTAGGVVMLVAKISGEIAGTVQLDHDTMPNQPHRAEVRKMMVHPRYRRRGIARLLMTAIEHRARLLDRTLLTLDTRTGDVAEPLYTSMGFKTTGIIPGFCLDPFDAGKLDSTTIMYKQL